MSFKDHFSTQAAGYARHRPPYPAALFEWLASLVSRHESAWDCATGSGQAAVALARWFDRVIATDASGEQLERAVAHSKVTYRLEPAEKTSLADASCDLVTVAQALHWFDWPAFNAEVRRVGRRGGVLAAWMYDLMRVEPAIDHLLDRFLDETVGDYWPPERRLLDRGYVDIPFPFPRIEPPRVAMELEWTAAQTIDYVGTWSAIQRFRAARDHDPLPVFAAELTERWGPERRRVRWPLTVLAGRLG